MEKNLLDISVNTGPLQQAFQRLQNSVTNIRPLMRELAGTLLSVSQQNFMDEGHPPWTPSLAAQQRKGQTLTDTGHLSRSIQAASDDSHAMVGTNVVYAAIHQSGGTVWHKSRASKDKRKRKKGLMTVAYHQVFPARPFLPAGKNGEPQAGLEQTLLSQTEDYLKRAVTGKI